MSNPYEAPLDELCSPSFKRPHRAAVISALNMAAHFFCALVLVGECLRVWKGVVPDPQDGKLLRLFFCVFFALIAGIIGLSEATAFRNCTGAYEKKLTYGMYLSAGLYWGFVFLFHFLSGSPDLIRDYIVPATVVAIGWCLIASVRHSSNFG